MSTLLKQKQNTGKALEIRMERESLEKYHVILAATPIHYNRNCANGNCEGNFMFMENITYKVNTFNSLTDASQAYEDIMEQYID